MSPAAYDRRIRGLIPHYDELIHEVAHALVAADRPIRCIVDLGIGTGALARACLKAEPQVRVVGIEIDPSMAGMAKQRLGALAARVTGRLLREGLPGPEAEQQRIARQDAE